MTRPIYWPTNDSYTMAIGGYPQAGIPVRIWTRQSGGAQVLDLVYVNFDGSLGAAVASGVLYSDANGLIPAFAGPDNGPTTLFGDHGMSGERIALTSGPGAGGGGGAVSSVVGQTGAVTGSQIAADSAMTSAFSPGGTAGNAGLTQVITDVASTASTDGALTLGKHNPVDATSGARTMTLADATAAGRHTSVEKTDPTTNTVTVTGNIRGTASSLTLVWQREAIEFLSKADGSWWPIAGHKTKTSLDGQYANRSKTIARTARPRLTVALPTVMTFPPTVTFGSANAASSLTNPVTRLISNSQYFLMLGSTGTSTPGNDTDGDPFLLAKTVGPEYPVWKLAWYTDAPVMEVVYQGSASPAYRLLVDGQYVTATSQIAGNSGSGQTHRMKITFTSRKFREVTIESGSLFISKVTFTTADTVIAAARKGPTLATMGDSFVVNGAIDGIGQIAAKILGMEWLTNGSGGTGYNNNQGGASGKQVFIDRLPAVLAKLTADDYIAFCGGINDSTIGLQAQAQACAELAKTVLPADHIFFTGAWNAPSQGAGSITSKRDLIKAGALAAGVQFIDNIAEAWMTGTGTVGSPSGEGPSDIYMGGVSGNDTTHPYFPDGYIYHGTRLGLAVANLIGA